MKFNKKIYAFLITLVFLTSSSQAFALAPQGLVANVVLDTTPASIAFGTNDSGIGSKEIALHYINPDSKAICSFYLDLKITGSPAIPQIAVYPGTLEDTEPNLNLTPLQFTNIDISNLNDESFTKTYVSFNNCPVIVGNTVAWIVLSLPTYTQNDYYSILSTSWCGQDHSCHYQSSTIFTNTSLYQHPQGNNWINNQGGYIQIEVWGYTDSSSFAPPAEFTEYDNICPQGAVIYQLCSAVTYVFVPRDGFGNTFTNKINELWDTMKTKVPFAYYDQLITNFESIDTANFSLTDITQDAVDSTLAIATTDHTNQSVPTEKDIFDYVRPFIELYLWLIIAGYLIFRVFRMFGNNKPA